MWEIHDKPSVFPIEDQFFPQWNNAIGLKLYGFEVIGENKSSEMQAGGGDHLPQKSCQLNKLKFNLVNECYCNDPVLIPVALRWLGISPTLHFPRVRLPRRVEWWMKWACGRFTGLVGSPCLFRRPGPVEGWHTWFNIVLKCIWIFFGGGPLHFQRATRCPNWSKKLKFREWCKCTRCTVKWNCCFSTQCCSKAGTYDTSNCFYVFTFFDLSVLQTSFEVICVANFYNDSGPSRPEYPYPTETYETATAN